MGTKIGNSDYAEHKCTVVIPTYNRPHHLKRIMSYYHQYESSLPVIIADSSSEENKKLNQETVVSFRVTSFTYVDKYDTSTNFYHKILDALQQVSTEYCVLCADDDFVTHRGIQEAVDFLNQNADFTTVIGKGEYFVIDPMRGGEPQFRYIMRNSQPNAAFESQERLIFEIANYDDISFYGVRDTDFMKMLLNEAIKYTEGDVFAEFLLVGLSAIYGKKQCLNTLFSVREDCTPEHLRRTLTSFQDYMKDNNYQEKKQKFSDCIAFHLGTQAKMDLAMSCKIVDKAITGYKKNHPQASSFMPKINSMITDLKLPDCLDKGIRKLYRTTNTSRFSRAYRAYSLTSQYCNDSNQIRLCVLSNAKDIYWAGPLLPD